MGATTERWVRLESLFVEAVALPPAEREAFLSVRCAGDEPLRARLRHMLESDEDRGVLDEPAVAVREIPPDRASTLIGRRVGDYHVLRVIASGGMGTVYEAQQEHPPRAVALKVLSAALASPEARRRFEFEAETLARLQHPAIAAIYESGVFFDDDSPHGRPFFAMELIHGSPLTQHANEHQLDLHERIALMIRVCEGVEHAHSRGVIHRDLKPANILVAGSPALRGGTPGSDRGTVKILDFGIARTIDANRAPTQRTNAGEILGTLAYMSPEQVAGDPSRIDIRSDVYALGVIAYELLGGRTPHDLTTLSMAHAARVILEQDPASLGSLDRRCRGDLETIVAKALEKDPDRRYQSASQLAEDLRRYLTDEPIAARRASRLYQLRKFARRNRALVAGMIGVFLALALGVIGTGWQWARAADQRDRAVEAEKRATAYLREASASTHGMHEFAEQYLSNIAGAAAARLHLAEQALQQRLKLPMEMPDERINASYAYQRVGDVQLVLGHSSEALKMYQTTLDLRESAAAVDPNDPTVVRTLAVAHFKMFDVFSRMGRHAESERHARTSVEAARTYATRLGDSIPEARPYLSFAHRRLGDALLGIGHAEEAIEHHRLSLEQLDPIVIDHLNADRHRVRGAALALRGWGEALAVLGRDREALAKFQESLALIEQLDRDEGPMNVWERMQRSRVLASIAAAHRALGEVDLALEHAQRAVDVAHALAAADRENVESQHAHAHALLALALAQARADHRADATASARQAEGILTAAIVLDPDFKWAQRDLAEARRLLADPHP